MTYEELKKELEKVKAEDRETTVVKSKKRLVLYPEDLAHTDYGHRDETVFIKWK